MKEKELPNGGEDRKLNIFKKVLRLKEEEKSGCGQGGGV